jgi:hypothetical protein
MTCDEEKEQALKDLRAQIVKDLEELETPTDISSDWYAASVRMKTAAISIAKYGLSQ